MHYQTFEKTGDSDSWKKWQSLGLTLKQVLGKECLDLGCNEGFFGHQLVKFGASKVVGIDVNPEWIRLARERAAPGLEFLVGDWSNLDKLPGTFDLILILSSFHYAASPEWFNDDGRHKLLVMIKEKLNPGGFLIWEGGIVDKGDEEWCRIDRGRDVVYHPTRKAFEKTVRKTFSTIKLIGPSVDQKGDPIPRYVYHIMF